MFILDHKHYGLHFHARHGGWHYGRHNRYGGHGVGLYHGSQGFGGYGMGGYGQGGYGQGIGNCGPGFFQGGYGMGGFGQGCFGQGGFGSYGWGRGWGNDAFHNYSGIGRQHFGPHSGLHFDYANGLHAGPHWGPHGAGGHLNTGGLV